MTLIRRCLSLREPAYRDRGRALVLALALGLGCCPSAAWGQSEGGLNPALIGETNRWNDEQSKHVADYLRGHLGPMLGGQEGAIAQARAGLLEPFGTAGVSESFVRQYARAVSRELAPAVKSETVQVRVNAMILVGRLPDASALEPVAAGLQDPDAGVRYLAAVALNGLLARDLVDEDQRGQMMQLVDRQLASETSSFAAAPMFKALLDAGEFDPLLENLNKRVGWHVGRAHVGFGSEAEALRGLFARLFVGDGTAVQLKQLSRAAVRYLWLAAKQLEAGNVSSPASHIEMIRVAHTALTSARERLSSPEPAPPGVVSPLTQQRWGDIARIAERWAELLQAPPVGLTVQDVSVTAPPPPAAEPVDTPESKAVTAG